jgi:predicted RNA-binding Zn ribbon-like protein
LNFDSHTSDVVTAAVTAVNLLAPGQARGADYDATDPDVSALSSKAVQAKDIEQLRAYAVRMHAVFAAADVEDFDDACELVNALLRETQAAPVLSRHDGEPWHLHFHAPDADWARSSAASMATGLAIVLGNPVNDRLGVCTAPVCDRVFVDTSRNGTKRFCSTACQNRVKAAAFRARQRP